MSYEIMGKSPEVLQLDSDVGLCIERFRKRLGVREFEVKMGWDENDPEVRRHLRNRVTELNRWLDTLEEVAPDEVVHIPTPSELQEEIDKNFKEGKIKAWTLIVERINALLRKGERRFKIAEVNGKAMRFAGLSLSLIVDQSERNLSREMLKHFQASYGKKGWEIKLEEESDWFWISGKSYFVFSESIREEGSNV